jgi:hypothetical protein
MRPTLTAMPRRALLATALGSGVAWLAGAPLLSQAQAQTQSQSQTPPPAAGAASAAPRAPAELGPFLPAGANWRPRGTGPLRVFLFRVYDATLWTVTEGANVLGGAAPYALDIVYNTAVKSEDIVNTSIIEMARLRNVSSQATINAWTAAMKRAFPDVASGDRLVGVHVPRTGVRFFHNGKLTAEVNDPAFSEAFFAIWLDEQTKRPELRRALLGLPAPQPGS